MILRLSKQAHRKLTRLCVALEKVEAPRLRIFGAGDRAMFAVNDWRSSYNPAITDAQSKALVEIIARVIRDAEDPLRGYHR